MQNYSLFRRWWHFVDQARFEVLFDGDEVKTGRMEVRYLAPSLMSLGKMIEEANAVLNGPDAKISVRVKSDFQTGSFIVLIEVMQTMVERMMALVGLSDRSLTPQEVIELVGFAAGASTIAGGVIGAIKKLGGKIIKSKRVLEDGSVRYEIEEEDEPVIIPARVDELLNNRNIRQAAYDTLSPLASEGIDVFEVRSNGKRVQRVEKSEYHRFKPQEAESEELTTNVRQVILEIYSPAFPDGRKWEFHDGGSRLFARVSDEAFLADVEDGRIAFRKRDKLFVDLLTTQVHRAGKLETEHEVVRVLKHFEADEQLRLKLDEEKPDFDDDETSG